VAAITILKTIGGSNVQDALMTTLETEGDFTIYRAAADALHDIGDTQIVDRLITLVEGQDLTKATRAAHVLGNIKDSRAVEPMCALLDKVDRSPGETVVAALANFYDLRVVEALIRAFGKDQTTARPAGEVLVAWSKISVDPLIEALKHPDYKVRQRAVQALWKVKDDRAIEPLKAILDDEDGAVRMTVQNALKSFGVDVAK
jgi:HEAT repeat protein